MTRVRILQGVSGLDFSWIPGEVIDMEDDAAAAWADGYRAEYADQAPPPPAGEDQDQGDGQAPDPALFDPGAHNVADVLAYLQDTSEQETVRVLDAEQAGQDRKGIGREREQLVDAARERDSAAAPTPESTPAEVTAQDSRGGGRGEQAETR